MHFVFFGCFYSVIKPLPLSWVLMSDGAIFLYANVICKLCRLGGRFFCLLPEHSCPSLADWPSSAIMLLRYAAYGCPRYFLPMKNLPPPSEIYASNGRLRSSSSSFLACNSRLRSAIRRHHPPQRAVLSQICCFGERKVVLFQILLNGAEPCDAGTTQLSSPVCRSGGQHLQWHP